MVTNLLPRKEVAETGWSSEAGGSGISPACLGLEQAVLGGTSEHHPLLCSLRLQGTAELLSAATRESCAASLEGKEAPENCALLEELRFMTWPRSVMRPRELNGCVEIGHFASWVAGFSGSTEWLLENKHWEHLSYKRYLTVFMGGS